MICKRDSIASTSLEGRGSFFSNIANFLAHVARCAIFALKARRFLHSTRDGGRHTEVQNFFFGYGTVLQSRSISGADDVPPARRLWNICAVVYEELWHANPSCAGLRPLHFVAAEPHPSIRDKNWDARKSTRLVSVTLGWD